MPWADSATRMEVARIHAAPGTAVRRGQTVLTLAGDRGKHPIKAPHAGWAVPLVSEGDPVAEGDALYTLRLESGAPAGHRPAESIPGARARIGRVRAALRDLPRDWAWFMLALGTYALGARFLMPH
ncbi:MAG: biotin/lipoyl-containing protein, partial [Pseudomonadota bacterium]